MNFGYGMPGDASDGASGHPTISHTVRADETLASLARRYNTSEGAILRLNPLLSEKSAVEAGQVLEIPCGWC